MAQPLSELDIVRMTVPERLELIGTLWDTIPETMEELPLPASHRKELEQRIARANADPESALPWEQVKIRLRYDP